MPRRRRTASKPASAKNCAGRINYAKLKEDEGSQTSVTAPEPHEALGKHRNSKANDIENQGHGLTGALAPQSASTRRWAGVLMSKDGFDDARGSASPLGFALGDGPGLNCRFDIERYKEMIDGADYSDEQKEQIVLALLHIGQVFYDMGFGLDMTGQACGQLEECEDDSAAARRDMVSSQAVTLKQKFNLCAA